MEFSPLLGNIYLNAYDRWVKNQWETFEAGDIKDKVDKNGKINRGPKYQKLRKETNLKEVYLTRFADDTVLQTPTRDEAEKMLYASIDFLEKHLKLKVSQEKTKIVNIKKKPFEYLGMKYKAKKKNVESKKAREKGITKSSEIKEWKKKQADKLEKSQGTRTRYVIESHVKDSNLPKIYQNLKKQVIKIKHAKGAKERRREIGIYNSIVIGVHNYFKTATDCSKDFHKIQYNIEKVFQNKFNSSKEKNYTKTGTYTGKDKGITPYLKSDQMRYLYGFPIVPIGFIKHEKPTSKKTKTNIYTREGRLEIHANLKCVVG